MNSEDSSFDSPNSLPLPKKRETKKGIIANTSTTFIPSLRKAHFWGAPASLMKYSRVNQAMQTVSTMARDGLSIVLPLASLYWRLGRVLMVIPTMEMETKMVERTLQKKKLQRRKLKRVVHVWYENCVKVSFLKTSPVKVKFVQ